MVKNVLLSLCVKCVRSPFLENLVALRFSLDHWFFNNLGDISFFFFSCFGVCESSFFGFMFFINLENCSYYFFQILFLAASNNSNCIYTKHIPIMKTPLILCSLASCFFPPCASPGIVAATVHSSSLVVSSMLILLLIPTYIFHFRHNSFQLFTL